MASFIVTMLRRISVYSIGFFWSSFVALQCLKNAIIRPRKFFYLKKRDLPPPCLSDTSLGSHSFVKLKNQDLKMHYVTNGEEGKPLMLFLHGFPEFWYSWRHQMREFSKDYRVVAIDQRGYGDTDKPQGIQEYVSSKMVEDIRELIPALGYDSCVLVAHDWGGAVAWTFTAKYPEMVNRLVVCNIPHPSAMMKFLGTSMKQFLMSWYMFFFQVPYFPEWYMTTGDLHMLVNTFRGEAMGIRNKNMFTDEDMEAFKYTFRDTSMIHGPINWYRAALQFPEKMKNKHIPESVPTLMVWGTADGALSREMAELSRDYVRNFTLKYIEGASHWVQQDEPDQVNSFMREFLSKNACSQTSKL